MTIPKCGYRVHQYIIQILTMTMAHIPHETTSQAHHISHVRVMSGSCQLGPAGR